MTFRGSIKISSWVVGIIAVILVLGLLGLGWRWVTAPVKGLVDARETITSGDSRIAKYDHFYDLCTAVQSHEDALNAQFAQLDNATSDSERERLRANISGLRSQRARSIRSYNQDSRKDYTQARFKDSELPYQLPSDTFSEGDSTTQCVK